MSLLQSQVVSSVIPFRQRSGPLLTFSASDRREIARWTDAAKAVGYDRMLTHERECGDAPDMGSLLAIHRQGQPWAAWFISRTGATLRAWSGLTQRDLGLFASMEDALRSIMPECGHTAAEHESGGILVRLSNAG